MRRHTFHLLAVTVDINPKSPREARVDFICQEDSFHFLASRATLEGLQARIATALASAPLHTARRAGAAGNDR